MNNTLRQARAKHLWTQQDMANLLGINRSTIIRWEKGVIPERFHQEKLSELLGMSAAQLGFLPQDQENKDNHFWYLPYQRNPFFTGRESVLQQLHATLAYKQNAVLSQSNALNGLGGIGKTQTAIEYAYRYANDYTAVFWISAETYESIVSSFIAIVELLNLPEKLEKEQSRVMAAVTQWLTSHNGWLIIFDNVEDLELVKGILPPARCGSLLFTSRRQALGFAAQTLGMEQMTVEEGIRFLLHRTRLLDPSSSLDSLVAEDVKLAREIVAAMDGLPLALDQAGAYIEATQCSLSDYWQLFQSSLLRLLDERDTYADHPSSVMRTFALAFEQLERNNRDAAELLTICAFLAPEAIPETFFIEGAGQLGPTFEKLAADPFAFQIALKALLTYSLIQRNAEDKTVTIHRLVQAVLKGRLSETVRLEWETLIFRTMTSIFPAKIQAEYWQTCKQLLPHAQVCLTRFKQRKENEFHHITLLAKVANFLQELGRFAESEQLFLDALSVEGSTSASNHLPIAEAAFGLAQLYRDQGKYKEAELLFHQALSILDGEHPFVARIYNSLAGLYRQQGKYSEAEPLYQKALFLWEQATGSEHHYVSYAMNNLANLYRDQGKYALAVPFYQRALHLWEQTMGSENLELAFPLQGLARCFFKMENYEEAEVLFQRALHLREQIGSDHYLLAEPLVGLATVYTKQGKYAQAESLFQRALHLREGGIGSQHHFLAEPLVGLATVYTKQGKYAQAESLFQRALVLRQQQLVSYHPDIAEILYCLGHLYLAQQQMEKALPLYQRALIIRGQVFGMDHPETLEVRNVILILEEKQG